MTPTSSKSHEYIPRTFRDRVLLHVCRHQVPGLDPPLLLGIQGPMGCGKSFQTRRVCDRYRIAVTAVSGADLSGQHEKASVEALYDAYIRAATASPDGLSILLIDDFHLSVASTFAGREYTVNSQLLVGALMNLADDPTRVGTTTVRRTPVVVTGNDFTALYGPLTRHGRMEFFDWRPTAEDRHKVVATMLRGMIEEAEAEAIVTALVDAYAAEPVAFFSAIRTRLYDAAILDWIGTGAGNIRQLRERVGVGRQFTRAEILDRAAEVHTARPRNHLPDPTCGG